MKIQTALNSFFTLLALISQSQLHAAERKHPALVRPHKLLLQAEKLKQDLNAMQTRIENLEARLDARIARNQPLRPSQQSRDDLANFIGQTFTGHGNSPHKVIRVQQIIRNFSGSYTDFDTLDKKIYGHVRQSNTIEPIYALLQPHRNQS